MFKADLEFIAYRTGNYKPRQKKAIFNNYLPELFINHKTMINCTLLKSFHCCFMTGSGRTFSLRQTELMTRINSELKVEVKIYLLFSSVCNTINLSKVDIFIMYVSLTVLQPG